MKLSDIVQNSTIEIPKEDYILIEYELFFDECLGGYNKFSIDDKKDIMVLEKVLEEFMIQDNEAELYVCAYSYETVDYLGKKSMYADMLWINTKKNIKEIERVFEECKTFQPSDISVLKNLDEYNQEEIYLYKKNGDIIKFDILNELQGNDNIKVIYWD
ncbi:hypothetical protein [Clostridium butyricum]|uniref:hypothetical protein n=1 Tax=Clostridium butyricum TaxID=1492 RepID=UPI00374E5DEC